MHGNDKHSSTSFLMSRDHTLAVKGLSALLIMLLHFVMQIDGYPRVLNVIAGPCVAAFLFFSGYGINESWKKTGGANYWHNRIKNVLIPYWIVVIVQIPFWDTFDINRLMHNLLVYGSDLWFIDYIFRWYLAFWLCKKFVPKYANAILLLFSVCCLWTENLMAGQAISFVAGYLYSQYSGKWREIKSSLLITIAVCGVLFAGVMLGVKELDCFQSDKQSLPFRLLLVGINFPLCISLIGVTSYFPTICRSAFMKWLGRISYDIYIVHFNFMPFVCGKLVNIGLFSAYSLLISDVFNRFVKHLHTKMSWQKAVGVVLYMAINYLFACKYSMRVTSSFGYVVIPYLIVMAVMSLLFLGTDVVTKHIKRWHTVVAVAVCMVAMLIIQYSFDPMQNAVDRWSAIENPIRYLLDGDFPYLAPTHLGGKASPFPVWQVFHIPFYFLGNVGLSEIFGIACFIMSVWYRSDHKQAFMACLLTVSSIAIVYEVSVRSDLIANFMLLSAFVNITHKRNVTFQAYPYMLAMIAGLWFSTRITTLLPLFILYMPGWQKLNIARKITSPLLAVAVLLLTFLPFYLWNADALLYDSTSPFVLQTRQGGMSDVIITLVVVIVMIVFYIKQGLRHIDFNIYAALAIVMMTSASFVRRMIEMDAWNMIFESTFDITYFNMALPFVITALSIEMVEKK